MRARLALERLGGAWIKLGQMLAMRFDLLPPAYCDELFKLLNQVKPFPYDQVREIVREELGDDPEVIFRSFETQSFAAASIGQVHRAVLHTGEHVAVKVQRPGIRAILQADIQLMYAFSGVLNWTHLFGATKSREVIDEFARWTADELDYLVEARQAVLLYEHAQGDALERIARVYREYTTSRVLTAELIEGIPLIEIILARRERNTAYLEAPRGPRLRPRSRRPPPRLEHAQPGLRVRLLPRRPAPGQPVRAARQRHRLRRLRDRRPDSRIGSASRSSGTAGSCSRARSRTRSPS